MKIGRISKLLLSFLNKIISFFSFIHHQQKLVLLFPKSAFDIKHTYVLVLFLALSLFILALFLKGSSKKTNDLEESSSHSHYVPSFSMLELYPLSNYHVDQDDVFDESYGLVNVVAKYDQEILDESTCSTLANNVVEDDQEFVPRLVHLELIESATGRHEDYKGYISGFFDVKLIKGAIDSDDESKEFYEFDGYDEDNDDEGDDDDVSITASDNDDDDLKNRVEEFIAKNVSKWKEEMLNDKFLYLEY